MAASKKEIKAESILNKNDGTLPYGYTNPETDGKLNWICGIDADGKITSVFSYDDGNTKEKKCEYLPSIEKAKYMKEELEKNGWLKIKAPEVTFTLPDGTESSNLNRKQRRYLERKINNLNKQNPFKDSEK